jgi:hypothetical protein
MPRQVRIVQRVVRAFQSVTESKLHLLTLQWRQLEHEHLLASMSKPKKADRRAERVSREDLMGMPLPHVPSDVRERALRKLLHAMRIEYRDATVRRSRLAHRR